MISGALSILRKSSKQQTDVAAASEHTVRAIVVIAPTSTTAPTRSSAPMLAAKSVTSALPNEEPYSTTLRFGAPNPPSCRDLLAKSRIAAIASRTSGRDVLQLPCCRWTQSQCCPHQRPFMSVPSAVWVSPHPGHSNTSTSASSRYESSLAAFTSLEVTPLRVSLGSI